MWVCLPSCDSSHGPAAGELRHLALGAPQAILFASLLFFSNVIRIQILYESPDLTCPSQAPALVVFLYCTKVDTLGQTFILSLLTEYAAVWASFLVSPQPERLCINCTLGAVCIYAFKKQTASFLSRWQIIKLFIFSQCFSETVVFEQKCHFPSAHLSPIHTNIKSLSLEPIVFSPCSSSSVAILLPQHFR